MFHVIYVALNYASTGQQIQANEQICISSAMKSCDKFFLK